MMQLVDCQFCQGGKVYTYLSTLNETIEQGDLLVVPNKSAFGFTIVRALLVKGQEHLIPPDRRDWEYKYVHQKVRKPNA
jgi:hypothetical protein